MMRNEMSTDFNMINQFSVLPNDQNWSLYLELIVEYICENWPSVLNEGSTKEAFYEIYKQELMTRFQEGRRILLLWKLGNEPIGIANIWVEELNHVTNLQIAEFSVIKKYRKKGFGRFFVQALISIGKQENVSRIVAEVDAGIEANFFWAKVLDGCLENKQTGRNHYWAHIG